jgi:hypothetical protein
MPDFNGALTLLAIFGVVVFVVGSFVHWLHRIR